MKKILLITFISLTTFCTLLAQVPNYVPNANLISWYSFDGDANDDATSGNDLTVMNGAALTTDRNMTPNSAYDFNGTNQYLVNSSPSFSFGQASTFTVSCWMYRSSLGYGVAMMNGTSSGTNFVWLFQTGSTGVLSFGTNKQGSAWFWAQDTYAATQWEHLVGTYDNGAMTFYKNGVQVITATNSHTGTGQAVMPLFVGKGVSGAFFTGKVDDIGIWDRVLTPTEVLALYNGCGNIISAQPNNINTNNGSTAKFSVNSAISSATYQWQNFNGTTYQDLSNGGQYSGSTSDTLVVSNVSSTNNGEVFRCIVDNTSGCVDTSQTATLNVCGEITAQPANDTVAANTTAQFSLTSSFTFPVYQWQADIGSGFVDISDGVKYTGTNTNTLSVNSASSADAGHLFRCISSEGNCMDTSDVAVLSVFSVSLEETNSLSIKLYPNPANTVLYVESTTAQGNIEYKILNTLGQVVQQGYLDNGTKSLDIKAFANGYYVLQLGELKSGFTISH